MSSRPSEISAGTPRKSVHRGVVALSVAIAALPTCAVAKTEAGADVSLSAAVASNPFQSSLGTSESASASLALSPWLTFTEAEAKLRLSGDVRITEYAKTFPRSDTFRASADGTWQVDPRLMLATNLSYSESTVGETNLVENLVPGIIIIEDPALVGIRARRQSFNTSVTAQYRPDPKQTWTFNFYAADSRFTNLAAGNNYAIYGETVRYDRVMRRGTFGASLSLQRYECRSLQFCSQVLTSPQLTASLRLSGFWTLSGAAGVSYATLRLPTRNTNTLTPSVNATLCRTETRSSVCLSVAHTVEATALGGARPTLSANLSTNYRITERNTITLSGNYAGSTGAGSTATRSVGAGSVGDTYRYFGVRLSDEHLVRRNMHLFVVGSHTISDSSFLDQRSNSEVSIGVRFSFGRGA